MSRRCLLLVSIIAALVWACGSQATVSQTIYAYFDVDGGLQFRYADSSNVGSTIPPGTYTINLNNNGADDLGVDHIFHIFGPGVDYKAANVDTQATFTATFQTGATYTIQDDDNTKIKQTILATNAPNSTQTTPASTTPVTGPKKPTSSDITGSTRVVFRGSLDAIVYKGGKLTLTRNGKTVTSLKTGKWTFAVDDESSKAGFSVKVLNGPTKAITSAGYVGNHDLTIALKLGRWFFFSPGGKKTTFFVTS